MPARVAKSGGLKDEMHPVASSASRDESIPGAYGEESSITSLSSGSPEKGGPKATPLASSHGTPAQGSIHLDVQSSGASTVSYDEQFVAEASVSRKKGAFTNRFNKAVNDEKRNIKSENRDDFARLHSISFGG